MNSEINVVTLKAHHNIMPSFCLLYQNQHKDLEMTAASYISSWLAIISAQISDIRIHHHNDNHQGSDILHLYSFL